MTIGKLPESPAPPEPAGRREEPWGLSAASITPEISRRFRLAPGQQGVVVIGVDRDGAAARAGIQLGDGIEELDRKRSAR